MTRTRTDYRAHHVDGPEQGRGLTPRQAVLALEEAIGETIATLTNPCGASWYVEAHEQTQDEDTGDWVDTDDGTYVDGSRR